MIKIKGREGLYDHTIPYINTLFVGKLADPIKMKAE